MNEASNKNKNNTNDLKICISCPVETKVLQVIRIFITSIARDMGFNEEDAAKIEIAVDEACANVVLHAYNNLKSNSAGDTSDIVGDVPSPKNYEIKLNVIIEENKLKIDILDFGIGSKEGLLSGIHEIEEYIIRDKKHGLGTYIIQKFMDQVEFDVCPKSGTKVSMIKYLSS
jgi:serine/threonine-protein kinase RsbW